MNAEIIRETRKALKMTQLKFALALNTNCVTVSRWENGHAKPSPAYHRALQRLARKAATRERAVIADGDADKRFLIADR